MALASEELKRQRRCYFTYIWRGLALMGIGTYAGIMILKNGIGNPPKNGRGLAAKLYDWLSGLMAQGGQAEKLVPICFAGIFFILAAIGLYNVVKGGCLMAPARTLLGKSLLRQAKNNEKLSDMLDAIDTDMRQEPKIFGSILIGRKWILQAEAIRLADICGVFWMDAGMEDYVLCCVAQDKNIWACGLRYKDDRDNAAKYLKKILPDVVTGDSDAYQAYLQGGMQEAKPTGTAGTETPEVWG